MWRPLVTAQYASADSAVLIFANRLSHMCASSPECMKGSSGLLKCSQKRAMENCELSCCSNFASDKASLFQFVLAEALPPGSTIGVFSLRLAQKCALR